LPPGRGETGHQAHRDRIAVGVENDRDRRGRLLRGEHRTFAAFGHDHVDLAADEIRRQGRQPIEVSFRPAIFDRNVLALDVAEFAHPLAESGEIPQSRGVVRRCGGEDADHRHRLLLRAGQERICRRAGEHRHEIAASHPPLPALTLSVDYCSTEPPPKSRTNGGFPQERPFSCLIRSPHRRG
jgi:hypothetical protein